MKLGILAAGITPDELIGEHGSYADMIIQLLDKTDSGFSFEVFDVREGEFPQGISGCDAWVISGSKFNAYDREPWMLQLRDMIKEIHTAKLPLVGICFGHQIIASTFGAELNKFEGGWGLGLHEYDVKPGFDFVPADVTSFKLNAIHQDQVLTKPDNAEVFASSEFCPFAGLVYGDLIFTVQAHPEFNGQFEKELLELRSGTSFPVDITQEGLDSLNQGVSANQSDVGSWIAAFLNKHK
ncbi:glutamine amidotransferase [Bermanella sp. 47_1433_sub80_T6]|nr:glutamine amidotransferase [Bermanella sp. 47_1433_sub80_T6]